jgi:hypothetical protein
MRATSPLDPIQDFGEYVALPQPKYALGTPVNVRGLSSENLEYLWGQTVREILRDTQKTIYSLKAEGFMPGMVGRKMPEYNKAQIRLKLDLMRYADSVELAGIAPVYSHVTNVANACYLVDGQCHGGVKFRYHLLFRRVVDGRSLVYLHPYPLLSEELAKNLVRPPAPNTHNQSGVQTC